VALISDGTACPLAGIKVDLQIKPDGSSGSFSIPTGQVLVVTGFDWAQQGLLASQTGLASLLIESATATNAVFVDGAIADSKGVAVKAAAVPNVVVKPVPGAVFCFGSGGGAVISPSSVVHGFLTKDK
jgi:hypothetical protein